jgi:hypothetical protein
MKTIKQIAEELGIDKQRVYRYIKKHRINEAHHTASKPHHDSGVMYFDEAAEILIKQVFLKEITSNEVHRDVHQITSKPHHEAHQTASNDTLETLVSMLKKELEIKNKQIEELSTSNKELTSALVTAQQTAATAQALHAGTIQAQMLSDNTQKEEPEKRTFWQRIYRKK